MGVGRVYVPWVHLQIRQACLGPAAVLPHVSFPQMFDSDWMLPAMLIVGGPLIGWIDRFPWNMGWGMGMGLG